MAWVYFGVSGWCVGLFLWFLGLGGMLGAVVSVRSYVGRCVGGCICVSRCGAVDCESDVCVSGVGERVSGVLVDHGGLGVLQHLIVLSLDRKSSLHKSY